MQSPIPTLETSRLILRAFVIEDAGEVKHLAGDAAIARNTLNVPHPYPLVAAQTWIASHLQLHRDHGHLNWAVCSKSGALIGTMNLAMNRGHHNAMLGYWIGVPYWNQGYCTEGGRAVIEHAFDVLNLHRMHSHHIARNVASGAVLRKLGFVQEGVFREHIIKDGVFEDVVYYGMVRPASASPPKSG